MNAKPNDREVNFKIAVLERLSKVIPPYSLFGDDNVVTINAAIRVLRERMTTSKVNAIESNDEEGLGYGGWSSDEAHSAALTAALWLNGDEIFEDDGVFGYGAWINLHRTPVQRERMTQLILLVSPLLPNFNEYGISNYGILALPSRLIRDGIVYDEDELANICAEAASYHHSIQVTRWLKGNRPEPYDAIDWGVLSDWANEPTANGINIRKAVLKHEEVEE